MPTLPPPPGLPRTLPGELLQSVVHRDVRIEITRVHVPVSTGQWGNSRAHDRIRVALDAQEITPTVTAEADPTGAKTLAYAKRILDQRAEDNDYRSRTLDVMAKRGTRPDFPPVTTTRRGDTVWAYAYGYWRAGIVLKVGRTRATVAYQTPSYPGKVRRVTAHLSDIYPISVRR